MEGRVERGSGESASFPVRDSSLDKTDSGVRGSLTPFYLTVPFGEVLSRMPERTPKGQASWWTEPLGEEGWRAGRWELIGDSPGSKEQTGPSEEGKGGPRAKERVWRSLTHREGGEGRGERGGNDYEMLCTEGSCASQRWRW